MTQFQGADVLLDHNNNVNSLCLTEKYLISGSDDKTIMVLLSSYSLFSIFLVSFYHLFILV